MMLLQNWRPLLTLFLAQTSLLAGPTDLDPTFEPPLINGTLRSVALQSDGKILITGAFSSIGGRSQAGIARLLPDGSLDHAFVPPHFPRVGGPAVAVPLPDGKVLVNRTPSSGTGICRLNPDGSLDEAFQAPDVHPGHIQIGPDGMIYISGYFHTIYTDPPRQQYYLARLHPNGSLDASYWPPTQPYGPVAEAGMLRLAFQPNGQVILAGVFETETRQGWFSRFHTDGSQDFSFTAESPFPLSCNALAVQPDGRILHGFMEDHPDFTYRALVRRYHSDRSLDTSFKMEPGVPGIVYSLEIQPDSKILVAGLFYTPDKSWNQHVIRLHPDGRQDTSFTFDSGFEIRRDGGAIYDMALQKDGKLLLAGEFAFHGPDGQTNLNLIRIMNEPAFLVESRTLPAGDVQFRWDIANTNLTYELQASETLESWSTVATVPPGTDTFAHTAKTSDSRAHFFKLLAK